MAPQSPVHTSGKNVLSSENVKDEITEMAIALNFGTSEATGMAVRGDKIWSHP